MRQKKRSETFCNAQFNYLCRKIFEKKDHWGFISHNQLNFIFGVCFRVPREFRNKIIAELIELNYLEAQKEGKRYNYKVLIKGEIFSS